MSALVPKARAAPRSGFGPFALLTLTDVAAVATLARCFTGPGELAIAVPACLLAHLIFGGGRRLAVQKVHRGLIAAASLALAAAVTLLLPLAVLDGSSLTGFLPLGGTWHLVHGQLSTALAIFSNKVAPVTEAPGLVLVTGWAAGAVALGSEVLYADGGLPAVLALVPAFDVVVFTGTLGTSSGRAIEVALIAALALSFLAVAQGDRRSPQRVIMARTEAGQSGPARLRGGLVLPGLALVAAVAAGVVGPLIPGAGSAALLSWHGGRAGSRSGPGGAGSGPTTKATPNKIQVSDLVQVAEQEVENPATLLFTVHSRLRTREVLQTLDRFNGVAWSQPPATSSSFQVPAAGLPLPSSLDSHLPKLVTNPDGSTQVTQVVEISALGGSYLPTPGATSEISGEGPVTEATRSGPLKAPGPLTAGVSYGLSASLPPRNGSLIESEVPFGLQTSGAPPGETQLPAPVPASLSLLAHRIVRGTTSEFSAVLALQDYFLTGHGFVYHLPTVTPKGAIANTGQSYRALEAFLFSSRTGYCQQYATAFAVLARLDGIPTRIALGFLPGKEIGPDEFEVTGLQVHAWPQVWFPHYGWTNFDPTPGGSSPSSSLSGPGGTVPTPPSGPVHPAPAPAHNFRHLAGSKGAKALAPPRPPSLPANRIGQSGLGYLVYALLALGVAWALLVPALRAALVRRLRRDPERAMAGAWRQATAALAAASTHRRRTETNFEFAERVRRSGILSDRACRCLASLAARMDRAVYGRPLPKENRRVEAATAWREAAEVRRSARRQVSRVRLLLSILDPRDLVSR